MHTPSPWHALSGTTLASPDVVPPTEEPKGSEFFLDVFPLTNDHALVVARKRVHLIQLSTQRVQWSLVMTDLITGCALSADQSLLALVSPVSMIIWDLRTGQERQRLPCSLPEYDHASLLFGPDVLAFAPINDGVFLWDLRTGRCRASLMDEARTCRHAPKSLALSPDGELLAVGHAEGSHAWLWRIADGQLVRTMHPHPWERRIRGLAFHPSGRWLLGSEWSTDPEEESMPIWDVATGEPAGALPAIGWEPAFSADGNSVATYGPQGLTLWRWDDKTILWQHEWEGGEHLHMLPSGRSLVSCGMNVTTWWDIQQGRKMFVLKTATIPVVRGALSDAAGRRTVLA